MEAAIQTMKRRHDDQTLNKIIKFWPLLVFIIGGIVTVAVMQNKVDNHEVRITNVESDIKDLQKVKANTDLLVEVLINRRSRRSNPNE